MAPKDPRVWTSVMDILRSLGSKESMKSISSAKKPHLHITNSTTIKIAIPAPANFQMIFKSVPVHFSHLR
jgi:hypothetical protein